MLKKSIKILLLIFLFCLIADLASAAEGKITSSDEQVNLEENPEDISFADSSSVKEIYDPLEKVNRKIFAFNEIFDRYFFEHIARAYHDYVPNLVRTSAGNFLHNLSLPLVVVNSAFQGNLDNSMASFSTFLINSTIGIGGLFDVAKSKKIKYFREDFGQTFAKYKVGQGPYLILPFLGPSDLRDATGLLVEKLVDPLSFNGLEIGGSTKLLSSETSLSLAGASAVDTRESLLEVVDDIRKNSFDGYATIRSAYLQKRNSLINNK